MNITKCKKLWCVYFANTQLTELVDNQYNKIRMFKNTIGTKSLLALALAVVIGGTAIGASTVSADTTTQKQNFVSGFVTAISKKFGLSENEVKAVLDVEMQKHKTEMEAKFSADFATRLANAVTNGKLTQAQADLIKAKQIEVKAKMDALHTTGVQPTDAQKTEMKALMESVKTWAKANSIPTEYVMLGTHKGKGFGMRMKSLPQQ